MRKFILIAALVLVSATTAQAGGTRGLTLASNDEPAAAAAEQPKAVEAPKATDAPKYVDRPAAINPTQPPKPDPAGPVADNNTPAPRAEKPRRKRESTEARIIYELHRHGIYW